MTILSIQHLSKKYSKSKFAVNDLNLEIQVGDIFGFIGHNGAGKTTTIRSIIGALHFDQGEILINGQSIRTDPLICKQQIAYVPDNPDLYEYLTGIQYINFIADMYGISESVRNKQIKYYCEELSMTDYLGNQISSYSHGMKQKLAIISAFVHQPKLLIMDEPFVGLDPEAVYIVKQMLKELCQNNGAVFFSTHVLEVAENLCNKIGLIDQGRLKKIGLTEEVRAGKSLEEVFLEVTSHE